MHISLQKSKVFFSWRVLSVLLLIGMTTGPVWSAEKKANPPAETGGEKRDKTPRDRCVVLISVDGLANFYFDDPRAEMPTIRALAKNGMRAKGMLSSFPSVTWPNHTTLVTGVDPAKHGVLGNNYLDRKSGTTIPLIVDPLFDKDQIVKVPTIYDAAHRAGLVTAGIVWPATRNARTLDYTVPDMGGDAWNTYGTKEWLAELRKAGVPVDKHAPWVKDGAGSGGILRDWLYTRMAAHLFKHHPPHLIMIHLIEVDHVQHKYGPRSDEAYWAVSQADDRVRDIVEAAKASPFAEKTTIIVASDHGFFPIEEDICPHIVLRKAGLRTGKSRTKDAVCVAQGGGAMIYLLDDANRKENAAKLKQEFQKMRGMEAVLLPDEFGKIGQATPALDQRAPDLWLAAKSGFSFSITDQGDEVVVKRPSRGGTHGYLADDKDMLATLVMSGHGVRKGTTIGKISNRDVAPTIARLLQVPFPTADGRVLQSALSEK